MKIFRLFLISCFSFFLIAACAVTPENRIDVTYSAKNASQQNSSDINQIKKVVGNLYGFMADGNTKEMMSLLDLEADGLEDMIPDEKFDILIKEAAAAIKQQGGIQKIDITDIAFKKEATEADLELKLTFGDGSVESDSMTVVKTKSGWKAK